MLALARKHFQHLPADRCEIDLARAVDQLSLDEGLHALVVQRRDAEPRHVGELTAYRFGIGGMA